MGSNGSSISKQVFEFLDSHEKYTLKEVQDVFNKYKKQAVKSPYYRWHKRRTPAKKPKRPNTIPKNRGTLGTQDPITPLSPELQNIKNIMQTFNDDNRTNVRFGEIAKYLETLGQLNIVAEGVTQSLKQLDNTQLLDYIRPTPLLLENLPDANSHDEHLMSMNSLQRLNYLTKSNPGKEAKSELLPTQQSMNASSSEQEGEVKPST